MSPRWSFLYSFLIFCSLEAGLNFPRYFWLAGCFSLLLTSFFIWLISRRRFSADFWNYLISPFLFFVGCFLFLGFADSHFVRQAVIFFVASANAVFAWRLTIFVHHRYRYREHSLSSISRLINVSGIFFFLASLLDFSAFLKFPFWLLTPFAAFAVYLFTYQFFCISKVQNTLRAHYLAAITLWLVELFILVAWLPSHSLVKAVLLVGAYYFFTGIVKYRLDGALDKTVWLRYSLMTGAVSLLALFTARWR